MSHESCLSSAGAVSDKLAQLVKGCLVLFVLKTELYIVIWATAFKFRNSVFRSVCCGGFSVLRVLMAIPDGPGTGTNHHPLEGSWDLL